MFIKTVLKRHCTHFVSCGQLDAYAVRLLTISINLVNIDGQDLNVN